MKKLITLCLLTISFQAFSQDPFPHLETINFNMEFCGETSNIKIHYGKDLSCEMINATQGTLPKSHPLYTNEAGKNDVLVMKLNIDQKDKREYFLIFSQGPSCDPEFAFYDISASKFVGGLPGVELFIPGNGKFYASGHFNALFNIKRKYVFDGKKFEEVKPEFYYVGLKTKTLKNIKLFSDESLTQVIADLPSNYGIEVLVAKRPENFTLEWKYLVKTKFGLVGWTIIKGEQFKSTDVDGIYFKGD